MTELSFLIELLLGEHKFPAAVRKRIAERIREVEGRPVQMIAPLRTVPPVQALSTQRLTQEDAAQGQFTSVPNHVVVQAPIAIPGQIMDKETGRPSIPTGNGTRGPRKF